MKITRLEVSLIGGALLTLLAYIIIYSFPVWDVEVSRGSVLTPLRAVAIALVITLFLVKSPIELQERFRGLALTLFGLGLAILLLMSVAVDIFGVSGELSLAWFIMAPLLAFIVVTMIWLAILGRNEATATTARSMLALISLLILASAALMLLSAGLFVGLVAFALLVYCIRSMTPIEQA